MSRLLSKERVRDLLLGLALLCATLALMLYPQPSMEAAKSGLALWGSETPDALQADMRLTHPSELLLL